MSDYISIHAPCEGGDQTRKCPFPAPKVFQSTPPARGATVLSNVALSIPYISIHAPCEGGDLFPSPIKIQDLDFNPRPPRGGRLASNAFSASSLVFQSTPPARGATQNRG